jgi:hypothetical protein
MVLSQLIGSVWGGIFTDESGLGLSGTESFSSSSAPVNTSISLRSRDYSSLNPISSNQASSSTDVGIINTKQSTFKTLSKKVSGEENGETLLSVGSNSPN